MQITELIPLLKKISVDAAKRSAVLYENSSIARYGVDLFSLASRPNPALYPSASYAGVKEIFAAYSITEPESPDPKIDRSKLAEAEAAIEDNHLKEILRDSVEIGFYNTLLDRFTDDLPTNVTDSTALEHDDASYEIVKRLEGISYRHFLNLTKEAIKKIKSLQSLGEELDVDFTIGEVQEAVNSIGDDGTSLAFDAIEARAEQDAGILEAEFNAINPVLEYLLNDDDSQTLNQALLAKLEKDLADDPAAFKILDEALSTIKPLLEIVSLFKARKL